jgi:hypothetical protein
MTTIILALPAGGAAASIAIWVGVVLASVLWHELGHAWTARLFGLESDIELYGMGGVTRPRTPAGGGALSWWKQAAIALAGPGAGLLLGGAVWLAARHVLPAADESAIAREIVRSALWVNVGWSFVNLLPVLPYDGGLALQAVLGAALGRARGHVTANVVSVVVGGAGCLYAIQARMFWAAYLAGGATLRGVRALREHRARALELAAWSALDRADAAAARAAVQAMPRAFPPTRELRFTLGLLEGTAADGAAAGVDMTALQALWVAMLKSWLGGGAAGGADVAARVERLVAAPVVAALPRPLLHEVSTVLFHGGEFRAALIVASRAFEAHREPIDAYNAACCSARLGEPAQACNWLERASAAGFSDIALLRADEDLASLRGRPELARVEAAVALAAEAAAR